MCKQHTHVHIRGSGRRREVVSFSWAFELTALQITELCCGDGEPLKTRWGTRGGRHGRDVIYRRDRDDHRLGVTRLSVYQHHLNGSQVTSQVHLVLLLTIVSLNQHKKTNAFVFLQAMNTLRTVIF